MLSMVGHWRVKQFTLSTGAVDNQHYDVFIHLQLFKACMLLCRIMRHAGKVFVVQNCWEHHFFILKMSNIILDTSLCGT